jgi:hypothetical protein
MRVFSGIAESFGSQISIMETISRVIDSNSSTVYFLLYRIQMLYNSFICILKVAIFDQLQSYLLFLDVV